MRYRRNEGGDNSSRQLILKDANIIFSNFAGKEGKFNDEGKRSFTVEIPDPEMARQMREDGWNVRVLPGREGRDEPDRDVIDVNVKYGSKGIPPVVELISKKGNTQIGEEEIGMLDWLEVEKVNLVINPYHYSMRNNTGIKGYLRQAKVWLAEDDDDADTEPLPF